MDAGFRKRAVWLAAATAAGALAWQAPGEPDARAVLAILAFTMVMWLSETLPLAATAMASSLLLVVAGHDSRAVFAAYFDPVIVLLLGGFLLGVALTKHGLDTRIAAWVLAKVGTRPSVALLAVMGITAVFSMWISNTAATAIMLPIALSMVAVPHANMNKVLVLGVAYAANIGGIATPIGTTANPIAIRFLAQADSPVTFAGWMVRAAPAAALLVILAWLVLLRSFPVGTQRVQPPTAAPARTHAPVAIIFGVTVALWLTTDVHGFAASTVALVPVVLLFGSGLLDESDIPKAGWPTLLLIGGGLALGDAVTGTGLDATAARLLSVAGAHPVLAAAAVACAAVVMTMVASNTAAAVLMIPVAVGLAHAWGMPAVPVVMLAATAISMDFLVPVGTPPNAMAYGTGHAHVRDMLRAGSVITVAAILVLVGASWLW